MNYLKLVSAIVLASLISHWAKELQEDPGSGPPSKVATGMAFKAFVSVSSSVAADLQNVYVTNTMGGPDYREVTFEMERPFTEHKSDRA